MLLDLLFLPQFPVNPAHEVGGHVGGDLVGHFPFLNRGRQDWASGFAGLRAGFPDLTV